MLEAGGGIVNVPGGFFTRAGAAKTKIIVGFRPAAGSGM
jgi:hypothetical protein